MPPPAVGGNGGESRPSLNRGAGILPSRGCRRRGPGAGGRWGRLRVPRGCRTSGLARGI